MCVRSVSAEELTFLGGTLWVQINGSGTQCMRGEADVPGWNPLVTDYWLRHTMKASGQFTLIARPDQRPQSNGNICY